MWRTRLKKRRHTPLFPDMSSGHAITPSGGLLDGWVRAILEHTGATELAVPNLLSSWAALAPDVTDAGAGGIAPVWTDSITHSGEQAPDNFQQWNHPRPIAIPTALGATRQDHAPERVDLNWARFFGAEHT